MGKVLGQCTLQKLHNMFADDREELESVTRAQSRNRGHNTVDDSGLPAVTCSKVQAPVSRMLGHKQRRVGCVGTPAQCLIEHLLASEAWKEGRDGEADGLFGSRRNGVGGMLGV